MALSDPQSITVGSDTVSLARTGMGPNSSTYKGVTLSGTEYNLQVTQNVQKSKTRSSIRIERVAFVPDTLIPSNNVRQTLTATIVVETPSVGVSPLTALSAVLGLINMATANTNAVLTKLVAGEV